MITPGLAKALVMTVLVMTVLTNVFKWVAGPQVNLMVDVVFFVVLTQIVQLHRIRYAPLVMVLLGYIAIHATVQWLIYGGLLSGNNYTDYRNFLRGGALFLLLLNTRRESADDVDKLMAPVFVAVALIAAINIYAEFVAYRVMGIDLRGLGYVQAAWRNVEGLYGAVGSQSRIPTVLGAPHFFGLTQASLSFVMWHLNRRGRVHRSLVYLTFGSVLLVQSRLQIFVVFGTLVVYFVRRLKFSVPSLAAAAASVVAVVVVFRMFSYSFVLTHNPEYVLAFDFLRDYGSLEGIADLITFPGFDDIHKVVVGVGGVTGNEQFNNIVNLAYIEIGLIVEMIPRYGMIFVGLYYAILFQAFARLRRAENDVLALALIPFMAAPLHMGGVGSTFVSDSLFVTLAYCYLASRADERDPGASGEVVPAESGALPALA